MMQGKTRRLEFLMGAARDLRVASIFVFGEQFRRGLAVQPTEALREQ